MAKLQPQMNNNLITDSSLRHLIKTNCQRAQQTDEVSVNTFFPWADMDPE